MRLLLIEDNKRLRELLREPIAEAGYQLDDTASLEEARSALQTASYDALILDLGLPDGDGLTFLSDLRREGFSAPVLVLTARAGVEDRIMGLDAGADDYLTKPFHNQELVARLRALLRRPAALEPRIISRGPIALDPAQRRVFRNGEPLSLTPREYQLFVLLFRRWEQVVAFDTIENALSEFGRELGKNTIEVLVSRLRRKLGGSDGGADLITVRGIGYMLRRPS